MGVRLVMFRDPRRHLHEVRGRSWLCMVEEAVVPPHWILLLLVHWFITLD